MVGSQEQELGVIQSRAHTVAPSQTSHAPQTAHLISGALSIPASRIGMILPGRVGSTKWSNTHRGPSSGHAEPSVWVHSLPLFTPWEFSMCAYTFSEVISTLIVILCSLAPFPSPPARLFHTYISLCWWSTHSGHFVLLLPLHWLCLCSDVPFLSFGQF